MAPKKIRCSFKECSQPAQRIVGDCGFCNGHYCARHRLLEDHKCEGLEDVSTDAADSADGASRACSRARPPSPSWWLVGLCGSVVGDGCNQEENVLANVLSGDRAAVQEAVPRAQRRPARGRAHARHQDVMSARPLGRRDVRRRLAEARRLRDASRTPESDGSKGWLLCELSAPASG